MHPTMGIVESKLSMLQDSYSNGLGGSLEDLKILVKGIASKCYHDLSPYP
jgi:hypothetical protein